MQNLDNNQHINNFNYDPSLATEFCEEYLNKEKAVIYTRLSDESEYENFKKQTEICEIFTRKSGLYLIDVYSDYPQHTGLIKPALSDILTIISRSDYPIKVIIESEEVLSHDIIHQAHIQTMISTLGGELIILDKQ